MAEVKWIKLATDIFDNRKIKQIRKMPESDAIIVIWFQILGLAGQINDSGLIYFSKDLPYTEEMLATEFDRPLSLIRLALTTFEKFEMIDIIDNVYLVANWEKYQSNEKLLELREKGKERAARYREKQKQLVEDCNVTVTLPKRYSNAVDIDIDIDKDIDKEYIPLTHLKSKSKYGSYKNVLLTDDEFNKLKDEPRGIEAIEFFSEYLEMKGTKYKSHYLAIKKWVFNALDDNKSKGKKTKSLPDWYAEYEQNLKNKEKKEIKPSKEDMKEIFDIVKNVFD